MRRHLSASRLAVGAAIISLLAGCAASGATSPAQANPSTTAAATGNAPEGTAEQWLAALQAKDVEGMAALFAPDGVWQDGATGEKFTGGPQAERSGWSVAMRMVVTVNDAAVLALGDGVAVVEFTLHGPTPGHTEAIDVPMIAVLQVKGARVTQETIYYNPRLAYGS